MGRPPKEINMEQMKQLLRLRASKEDVAAFFECSPDTIERRIKEHCDLSFTELRDEQMVHTKVFLIQKALDMAKKGNAVMTIFCLKNLCGWSNGPEIAIQNNVQAIATNNEAKIQIEERIKQLLEGKNGKN